MALDIYVQPKAEAPRIGGNYELITQFNDDGYYWFLVPLFENLWKKTGQTIDLYGNATFSGEYLDDLKAVIIEAKQLLVSQPKIWEVSTGTQISPVRKEIFSTVTKVGFEELLNKIEMAIEKAKSENSCVTFWGD